MTCRFGIAVVSSFAGLLLFGQATGNFWRRNTAIHAHTQLGRSYDRRFDDSCKSGDRVGRIPNLPRGMTVATNVLLEGKGANVGLIVTRGYRWVILIARSCVPGCLAGRIIWLKPEPLAKLEVTVAILRRMGARGRKVGAIDDADILARIEMLKARSIEAQTAMLINA